MAKGLPKWAIKKAQAAGAKNVFAYAWSLVKKTGKKKPKGLKISSRKSNPSGSRTMARRRTRSRRRRGGFTLPIAPIAGIVGGIAMAKHPYATAGDTVVSKLMRGNYEGAFSDLAPAFTGFTSDGKFHVQTLLATYGPMVAGGVIHWAVGGKLGINRMLGRAKVPIIRV